MANKKITELDAATSLASTDVVPVVDVSEDVTKKITATDLFRTLPDGTAAAPALAFSSDQANGVYLAGTDTVGISTGGTQRVTVDGSGNVTISGGLTVEGQTTTVESTIVTIDDKNIELGSVASPSNTTADGGGITLKGATDKTIKWINSTGYWTFNTGIDVTGEVQCDSLDVDGGADITGNVVLHNHLDLGDDNHIRLGAGDDLKIYHDGSTSFIRDAGTGVLAITSNGGHIALLNGDATENLAKFIVDGAAELYHNGAKKFETLSTGASVTGNLGVGTTSLQLDLQTQNGGFDDRGSGSGVAIRNNIYYSSGDKYLTASGAASTQYFDGSGNIIFYNTGTASTGAGNSASLSERLRIDSSGRVLIGETAAATANSFLTVKNGSGDCEVNVMSGPTSASVINLGDTGDYNIGRIQYDQSTNSLRFDTNNSERLRIDSSGRLLLGTTTEGEATADNFTIADSGHCGMTVRSGTSSEGNIFFSDGTSGDAEYRGAVRYFHSLDALTLTTSATERLRIDSSGRVAIGANNPSAYDTSAGNLLVSDTSANCGITIRSGGGTPFGMIHFADGTSSNAEKRAGRIVYGHSGDFMTFNTADSEALRINSSGNVGMGTTSPTAGNSGARFLHLHNSDTSGPAAAEIHFTNGTTGTGTGTGGLVTYYENKLYTWNYEANSLIFGTNNSEKARIDSSGRLMIGTSTEGQANADDLTVASSGHTGITVRSGTTNNGSLFFSDGTSGDDEFRGYVQYNHSDNRLVFGTNAAERLRIDSSGNVGIGDSSPSSLGTNITTLEIKGGAATRSGGIRLSSSDDSQKGAFYVYDGAGVVGTETGHPFGFITGNTERMRVDSSGRVLIGTTTVGNSYADNLTIADSSNCGITLRSSSTTRGSIYFSDGTTGNEQYQGQIEYNHANNDLNIYTAAVKRLTINSNGAWGIEGTSNYGTSGQVLTSNGNDSPTWQSPSAGAQISTGNTNVECVDTGSNGHITFDTEGSERMRIDSSGRLAIGTTAQGESSADNLTLADTGNCGLTIRSGTNNGGSIYFSDATSGAAQYDGYISYNHPNQAFVFGTGSTERMRIDSSGNVGIGTSSPGNTLHINGSSPSLRFSDTDANGSAFSIVEDNAGVLKLRCDAGNSGTGSAIAFDVDASERMRIDNSGRVGIGASTMYQPFEVNFTDHATSFGGTGDGGNWGAGSRGIMIENESATAGAKALVQYRVGDADYFTGMQRVGSNSGSFIFQRENNSPDLIINSSGKVGIGTDSPGQHLTIKRTGGQTQVSLISDTNESGAIYFGDTASTNRGVVLYDHGQDSLQLYTSASERLRINSSGQLMLGTTSPATNAEVTIRAASPQLSLYATPGNASRITLGDTDDHNIGEISYDNSDNSLNFATNAATRMGITGDGNVAIGTTGPFGGNVTNRRHLTLNGTSDAMFQWGVNGTNRGYLYADATNLSIINTQNGYLRLNTNDTERMRITGGGLVHVGTTTADGSAHVFATSAPNSYGFVVHNTNSNNSVATAGLKIRYSVAPNDTNAAIKFNDSSASRFFVRNNGNVESSSNSFGPVSSDERLKQDIVDAGPQWDDIKAIRLKKFRYKNDPEGDLQLGPIAQELETVSPGLIIRRPADEDEIADTSNTLVDGDEVLSFKASVLYMKAIKALQEAMARIEELEAKVAALEAS